MATVLFLFFQVGENGGQLVVEPGGMGLANVSDFPDNRIFIHDIPPDSSSGEQIIGHSYPFSSHTPAISRFMMALLI